MKNQNTKLLYIFIAVLVVLNAFQFFQTEEEMGKKHFEMVKNVKLEEAMNMAKSEVNKYKGLSSQMDKVVKEANIKFLAQEKRINKLYAEKNNLASENETLTNEINNIKNRYLDAIDSLLISESLNQGLASTIGLLQSEITELNSKLGKLAKFSISNVMATPLKEKEHGVSQKTAMAKKVKVIKVCYDLNVYKAVINSYQNVYLRVVSPNGSELYKKEDNQKMVMHPLMDVKVNYAFVESIEIKTSDVKQCIRWHVSESLKPGVYIVELFTEKEMLGTTSFTVK